MPQLNDKKKKNNHQQPEYHLTQPCPSEIKHTNKNSANISLYTKLKNHWNNLRRAETKSKKEFNLLQGKNSTFREAWEKETSNTITLKKKMKRQRNIAQMREQTGNTEVQIN